MWVTQTYLGNVELDANFFVYYLYEEYNPDQKGLTENIQRHLEDLGEVYGDKVSLMMPNPRFAGRIESEVRDFPKLWMAVHEMLPGLLLSPVPLIKLKESLKGCKFIPFKSNDSKFLSSMIRSIRQLADSAIESANVSQAKKLSWLERLFNAIEIKPGMLGVNIDIKRLAE